MLTLFKIKMTKKFGIYWNNKESEGRKWKFSLKNYNKDED